MNDEDEAGDIDDDEVANESAKESDETQVVFLPTMVGRESTTS